MWHLETINVPVTVGVLGEIKEHINKIPGSLCQ